ncbi:hypothetical protein SDC9_148758 [bioreactor metagenome]|uniref:Uncharacterized protein n=1 Tax=bioreactor metagenome TaxID=1076179 RepID=A0A645EK84_9ZZZZ
MVAHVIVGRHRDYKIRIDLTNDINYYIFLFFILIIGIKVADIGGKSGEACHFA